MERLLLRAGLKVKVSAGFPTGIGIPPAILRQIVRRPTACAAAIAAISSRAAFA